MQYAVLIYQPEASYDGLSADEQAAITAEYLAIRAEPAVVGGASLLSAATATTVRMRDGRPLVTDGPFADTKEVFGGYYLVEADDIDPVLELTARIPALRMGGAVEIRPLAMVAS